MRADADKVKLEAFILALGQKVEGPGTIYLTGGATALLFGWREKTIDVDIKADPEPRGFFEAIAEIKEALDTNVELASPDLFIPELPGWRERSAFICRVRNVDFRHFDFYSQALAKLERGHERDMRDVRAFVDEGLVDPQKLRGFFQEIRSELKRFPAIDEQIFAKSVENFCAQP
ncbi:MAG: DUF6036 family nucleotidyltransferase [Spartobacteria bacterium]